MSTQRRFEVLKDLFETNKQSITLGELIRIQKELFSYNIRALVGLRQETGYLQLKLLSTTMKKLQLGNLTLIEYFLHLDLPHTRKRSRNQLNKDLIILILLNQKYKYEF